MWFSVSLTESRYHLHYMVLALGVFLVMFGGTYSTPITVNYITECFPTSALEVSVIMAVYRQIFGLSLPFFVLPWRSRVGAGWLVGSHICGPNFFEGWNPDLVLGFWEWWPSFASSYRCWSSFSFSKGELFESLIYFASPRKMASMWSLEHGTRNLAQINCRDSVTSCTSQEVYPTTALCASIMSERTCKSEIDVTFRQCPILEDKKREDSKCVISRVELSAISICAIFIFVVSDPLLQKNWKQTKNKYI